jgi:hypothetical protein
VLVWLPQGVGGEEGLLCRSPGLDCRSRVDLIDENGAPAPMLRSTSRSELKSGAGAPFAKWYSRTATLMRARKKKRHKNKLWKLRVAPLPLLPTRPLLKQLAVFIQIETRTRPFLDRKPTNRVAPGARRFRP